MNYSSTGVSTITVGQTWDRRADAPQDVDFIKLLEEYDITPHEEFELNCEEVLRLIGKHRSVEPK